MVKQVYLVEGWDGMPYSEHVWVDSIWTTKDKAVERCLQLDSYHEGDPEDLTVYEIKEYPLYETEQL